MLFILTAHSYSFLPYLYNLSHRLTELNVSLFYLIKLIFFKNMLWRKKFLNKTRQFLITLHKMKSLNFSMSYNLLAKSSNPVIYYFLTNYFTFLKMKYLWMLQVRKSFFVEFVSFFPQCCFMSETQVLMTVSNFFVLFSRNHFLEGSFTFQWGNAPLGHQLWWGVFKKIMGWEVPFLCPPSHYGKLWSWKIKVLAALVSSTWMLFTHSVNINWSDSFCCIMHWQLSGCVMQ